MNRSDSSAGDDRWKLPFDVPGDDAGGQPWREMDWSLAGQFLNRFPVGIAVMSPELEYLWINDALERVGGVPREERLGRRIGDVLPGLDCEAMETRMREVLDSGEPVTDFEYRGRTRADPDREHAYSTSFFRLDDASGRAVGVCYMVLDVTDRSRARERLALLSEAGARTGSTLDVAHTAQELAGVCVPRLADFATVDLLSPVLRGDAPRGPAPGTHVLRRTGRASGTGNRHEPRGEVGESVAFPPSSPGARCLADGTSFFRPALDPEDDAGVAAEPSGGPRRTGTGPGACSVMLVPLIARDTVLGVATFIRWRPHDPFEEDDLLLAEEIAARASVYIDNAREYTREHSTALALQQDLLPQTLTTRTTLEFASRYLPADASDGVGGDWFDVIPLSGARVALVVGDVVGHGINAAVSMGRFRVAVRTLADMDLPPEELLAHLDDLLLKFIGEERSEERSQASAVLGASCLYLIYDPVLRTCVMARAGHPPPGIVTPDGSVTFPDLPPGPPLGLGGLPFESAEFELAEGSVLALYTDGLIESRIQDVDIGLERLRTALSRPGLPLEEQCTTVLETVLAGGSPEDDVALLLARTHALGADQVASWDLSCDPAVVPHARALVGRCLEGWGLADAAFTVELIASELVTNAVRHASGPLRLRLIRHTALICEVSDTSSTSPRLQHARTTDEDGRGLFLVAQIAQRWGTRHTGGGKTIWAEYDLPSPAGDGGAPGDP